MDSFSAVSNPLFNLPVKLLILWQYLFLRVFFLISQIFFHCGVFFPFCIFLTNCLIQISPVRVCVCNFMHSYDTHIALCNNQHNEDSELCITPGVMLLRATPYFLHSPTLFLTLAPTNLFSMSIIWLFQECDINGVIQCITFGSGLFYSALFPQDLSKSCVLIVTPFYCSVIF